MNLTDFVTLIRKLHPITNIRESARHSRHFRILTSTNTRSISSICTSTYAIRSHPKIKSSLSFNHLFNSRHFGSLLTLKYQHYSTNTSKQKLKMTPSTKVPTGVEINWDINILTAEEVDSLTADFITKLKKAVDDVANSPEISCTTILEPLLETEQWFQNASALVTFPHYVAVDIGLRTASRKAEAAIAEAVVEVQMREDVFQKLLACQERVKNGEESLSAERMRALDRLVRDGKRNGLHLEEAIRNEIKSMLTRMNDISLEYGKNLAEDKTCHYFTKEELAGVPESFLDGLEKDADSGKFKVTLQYPHLFPITKHCRIAETRKLMEKSNAAKCMALNTPLIEEVITIRDKHAKLLGYANHAAYVQEVNMVKNPENVDKFLMDLAKKLNPLWDLEKVAMLEEKKKLCSDMNMEFEEVLHSWDIRYLMERVEESKYSVDAEAYKQYFPIDHVTAGLLKIYQEILQVKFTLVPDAPVWHSDVTMYRVNDSQDNRLLGYFFLDMYPREGKYGHNCCIPMQASYTNSAGEFVPTVKAMVCNFTKPQLNKPALLDHSEVQTYFHEFGHIMHSICSETETLKFSGAGAVETDFVECPSQMLENWVWHKTPLAILSKHIDSGEPFPDEMVEKLVKSKTCNQGILNLRQIVLALFDQRIHKMSNCSTAEVYATTSKEITGIDVQPETNFAANFGHLLGGYSGRYYSYLWSQVFSTDLFDTGFGDDLMNPSKGLKYREKILKPGGSKDADEMLVDFLGRQPKPEPFLRSIGVPVD